MRYYLEDSETSAILCISDNLYLIENLRSSVTDCSVRSITSPIESLAIIKHFNKKQYVTGIKLTKSGIQEFALSDYPVLLKKQQLLDIQKPGLETLLSYADEYRAKNSFGFSITDLESIQYALTNPTRIEEYAQMLNVSTEFALTELTMIHESLQIDRFRVFTVCAMWKKKINQCTTTDEVSQIIECIQDSFWTAGITNG